MQSAYAQGPRTRTLLLLLSVFASLLGCTTGPMDVHELYYLGASNGRNHVYYRVRVTGRTRLGDAEFRQGWFPASAVDALFGDVSGEGEGRALNVQSELRKQIDIARITAQQNYLDDVLNQKDDAALDARLRAIERIGLAPSTESPTLSGARVIEYDPARELVTTHSGSKLVMVLSSNPDEIIGRIAQLAQDTKTEALFMRFADVLAARQQARAAELSARTAFSARVNQRLGPALQRLSSIAGSDTPDRGSILGALDSLIGHLSSISE